jgi:hypothetical protein
MKRIFLILVSVLLIGALAAGLAEEARPGDEVTVTLRLENTDAAFARVLAEFDGDAFELVGYTAADGEAGNRGIVVWVSEDLIRQSKPLPSGTVGTVTLKVRESAAPGDYAVSGALAECWDLHENAGAAAVTGGTVTVLPPCEHKHTSWRLTEAPKAGKDGKKERTCSDCGAVLESGAVRMKALPAGLLRIEEEAFMGTDFEAILIPDGCVSIGARAFANCKNLLYIRIPASVAAVADSAFAGSEQAEIDRASK